MTDWGIDRGIDGGLGRRGIFAPSPTLITPPRRDLLKSPTIPIVLVLAPSVIVGFATVNALGQNGTIGGEGGPTTTVSTISALQNAVAGSSSKIVQLSGSIVSGTEVAIGSNTTLIGLGSTARLEGMQVTCDGRLNVIIRNITFDNQNAGADMVAMSETHHIWIDHNTFVGPGGDGSLDITQNSKYFTVSWNHFIRGKKTSLTGRTNFNDDGQYRTDHHNWWDECEQRQPNMQTTALLHTFNNYFKGDPSFRSRAIDIDNSVQAYVEANYVSDWSTLWTRNRTPSNKMKDGGDHTLVNSGSVNEQDPSGVFLPSSFYSYTAEPSANLNVTIPAGAGVGNI